MRVLVWLLRILVFLVLFGFALNNRAPVVVHGLFGAQWHAPLVAVVLLAFGAGCVLGALAALPWRRTLKRGQPPRDPTQDASASSPAPAFAPTHPPREGL